jgi:hypothetical protein
MIPAFAKRSESAASRDDIVDLTASDNEGQDRAAPTKLQAEAR